MKAERQISSKFDLLSWSRLLRVSAVPTAVTNVLASFLLANNSWLPARDLVCLILCSGCLYASGMVLNDYFDREVDKKLNPKRPLPAGQISPRSALAAYWFLTIFGLAAALLVGFKSLTIGVLIVAAIFNYNKLLKHTALAPLAMGICRLLNVLLGASSYLSIADSDWFGFPNLVWWFAICLAILISGLTLFAQNEISVLNRASLVRSASIIFFGIIGLAGAGFVHLVTNAQSNSIGYKFAALIFVIALPSFFRIFRAISRREPKSVRHAVVSILQSLIFFDAAICYLAAPNNLLFPLATLLLAIPATLLSRWISPT